MAIHSSLIKLKTKIWQAILKNSSCFCPSRAERPRSAITCLADVLLWVAENVYRWHYWRFEQALRRSPASSSRKPRGILMVTRSLNPCGSIRQAVLLLQQLSQHGDPLIGLLALHLDSDTNRFYLPTLLSQNIPVETLQPTSWGALVNTLRFLPNQLQPVRFLLDSIARHQPHTLHSWQDGTNVKIGIAGLILGIPRIVLSTSNVPPCHFLFYRPYMRAAYRLLCRHPSVVLVNNSEYGARAYEQWLHLPTGTVRVVRNCMDFDESQLQRAVANRLEYRRQIPLPVHCRLIGGVMRLTEEKRPLLWLAIAKALHTQDPQLHFLMIGDGPMRATTREYIEQQGLEGVVHVMPTEKQLIEALAAMDLLLLTSRATGLANAVIEAQAVSIPVALTQAGGALEAIIPNKTGWEIPADDPTAAATRLLNLLNDPNALAQAAQLGPQFVQQQFGVQHLLQQYLAIYQQ